MAVWFLGVVFGVAVLEGATASLVGFGIGTTRLAFGAHDETFSSARGAPPHALRLDSLRSLAAGRRRWDDETKLVRLTGEDCQA